MPFIYAGIEADVLNDFVDIELDRLDPTTLDIKRVVRAGYRLDPWRLLRDRRRVAIIGSAGIGKTTFQRHTILEILAGSAKVLHTGESPLPVYVALKVVPNSRPFPIWRFIRDGEPFRGDEALFHKTTADRGLFLCLDGYDEIAFTGVADNYIQQELEILMLADPNPAPKNSEQLRQQGGARPQDDFYRALRIRSRIWVTSRPQFIQHHPIGAIGSRQDKTIDAVATLGIVGIGQHREALVRRVFARYSSTHLNVRALLDAEYFLQYIDSAQDGEIRGMSFNPLFLTVMSYNYAQTVLQLQRHDVPLSGTFDELILRCIDLLLLDLDEYKARQFTAAQRHAIENRRNQFVPEKKRYLQYLAGYSYLHDLNVFTESILQSILLEFLEVEAIPVGPDIRRTFEETASDRPSFVRQLIYCGVFVLVDASRESLFYDFPHRRFREVLATSYFSQPHSYALYIEQLAVRGPSTLVELTAVLRRSKITENSELQRGALKSILDAMLSGRQGEKDYVRITQEFVSMLPGECLVADVVGAFVSRVMEMRAPDFEASASILRLQAAHIDDIHRVETYIQERCTAGDQFGAAFGCSVLGTYSARSLVNLVKARLGAPSTNAPVTSVFVRALITVEPNEGWRFLVESLGSMTQTFGFFDAICEKLANASDVVLQVILRKLTDSQRLEMLLYLAALLDEERVSADQWARFTSAANMPYEHLAVIGCRKHLAIVEGGESLFYLSGRSVTELCRELQEQQKLLDVGKIGEAGIHKRALAIKERGDGAGSPRGSSSIHVSEGPGDVAVRIQEDRWTRYAAVGEEDVHRICEGLTAALNPYTDRFLTNLDPIDAAIERTLTSMFAVAKFQYNRRIVAFTANDSFVFTRQELVKLLGKRARELATWSAKTVNTISRTWDRVPPPMQRVPRYFV